MPKTRAQKAVTVQELVKEFKSAKAVAFANFQGLTVAQADELRKQAREAKVHYTVAKKTLLNRAAKEAGFDIGAKDFPGMLGAAFATEDEVAAAKVLGDLSKKTKIKLVGGIFEGAVVPAEKVITLSKLPSKKELLGMLVGTLNGVPAAFVRALNAIREKQEAGSSAKVAETSVPAAEVTPAPAASDAVPAAEEAVPVTTEPNAKVPDASASDAPVA